MALKSAENKGEATEIQQISVALVRPEGFDLPGLLVRSLSEGLRQVLLAPFDAVCSEY
jgi:hypothetical protein